MNRRLIIVLVLVNLVGIALLSELHAQNPSISPLSGLMNDAVRLADKPNAERLDVLKGILSEMNIPFEVESFSYVNRRSEKEGEGKNLVITIGSGNTDIVVGAHYDKVEIGSGLIDNGCSAIILTRIAKTLQNEKLNHRIRIVFFDKEENGLIGSAQFIEAHTDDPIISMINLDVNAYGNTIMMGPSSFTGSDRLYRIAKAVCIENDINFIVFPKYGGSDDRSFQKAGIENISIGIAPAEQAHQFWLSLNGGEEFKPQQSPKILTNIHSTNDALDLVEPGAMTLTYTVVLETLRSLDKTKN